MRNSKYKRITIGGEDYSKYFHFPFTIQQSLNEQLDYAVVELRNTRISTPFKPFTQVVIGSPSNPLIWVLGIDEVTEVVGTGRFHHTLTLLETTKEAERFVMSAKAFTNPIVKDYTDGRTFANGIFAYRSLQSLTEFEVVFDENRLATSTTTPIIQGVLPIYEDFRIRETAQIEKLDYYNIYVYFSEDSNISRIGENSIEIVGEKIEEFEIPTSQTGQVASIQANNVGKYLLVYVVPNTGKTSVLAEISVVEQPVAKPRYTVREVVQQLLETAETLRTDESPRYMLEDAGITDLLDIEAPEFRFANCRTLWENLREVGRYIHAMPRIYQNWRNAPKKVTFDRFGQTAMADMSKGRRVASSSTYNIGDYTAGLDAIVSNLVNVNEDGLGTITDPFGGGYLTMRTAKEEARIMEGSAFIKTHFPIERIVKVELGKFEAKGVTYDGVDITPYIFEKSEYDLLSSYSGQYPFSKTYAIFYNQGSPNIEGLWFKAQDTGSATLDSFQDYSITNIIETASGVPSGLFSSFNYTDLTFRVTYVPTVTARVRQYRQTYDGSFPSLLSHNQSASKLSSKALGENLRGQLAMLGTTSDSVTYVFPTLEDVPKAGLLYDDDDYISTVATRVYGDFVICQIGLSTGYNELGGYVEINNQIRQFEIPDTNDRFTILEEFCVIGKDEGDADGRCVGEGVMAQIRGICATNGGGGMAKSSLAVVQTFDENGKAISQKLALPCVSMPVGNSIYFGFSFEDNFSAGSTAKGGWISDYISYKLQTNAPYGDDFYAQAHSIGFSLYSNAIQKSTIDAQIQQGDELPNAENVDEGAVIVSTGENPVIWHKDSADAGHISYQLHFVSNNGILIGSYFAELLMSAKNTMQRSVNVCFFDKNINPLGEDFKGEGAVASCDAYVSGRALKFDISADELPSFKSWAIFVNGHFALGKNTSDFEQFIYFNFKRRIA